MECQLLKPQHIGLILLIFISSFTLTPAQSELYKNFEKHVENFTKYVNDIKETIGMEKVQEKLNNLTFADSDHNGNFSIIEELKKIAGNISEKLNRHLDVVRKLKKVVEEQSSSKRDDAKFCCGYSSDNLQSNGDFDSAIDVDDKNACVVVSNNWQNGVPSVSQELIDQMKVNFHNASTDGVIDLKWQYVGTEQGILTVFPATTLINCQDLDPRFRSWYIEVARPRVRNIVIMLDMSHSMKTSTYISETLFSLSMKVIDILFNMLDPRDNIAFVGFNNTVTRGPHCFQKGFVKASNENKQLLKEFLTNIDPRGQSCFQEGFDESFNIFEESSAEMKRGTNILMLITDGRPNEAHDNLTEFYHFVEDRLHKLNQDINSTNHHIKLFPVGLGRNVNRTIIRELGELGRRGGDASDATVQLREVSHMRNWMSVFLKTHDDTDHVISLPYIDEGNLGLICTIGLPVFNKDNVISGVVATDISIDSLFQEIRDLSSGNGSYSFVIDKKGGVFLHYLLPKPNSKTEGPYLVHIRQLECFDEDLFQEIISGLSGSRESLHNHTNCTKSTHSIFAGGENYTWIPIDGMDLILVVKIPTRNYTRVRDLTWSNELTRDLSRDDRQFIYHRLDLNDSLVNCKFYERRATINVTTVHLSKNCFENSHKYLIGNETPESIQLYYDFFNELANADTKEKINKIRKEFATIANEIKDNVIYDVLWTSIVNEAWSVGDGMDALLFGTESGLIRRLPGGKFQKEYDATKRNWYRLAKLNPTKMIFSTPYNDAGGVGRIFTISAAVLRKSPDDPDKKEIHGVLGLDLSLTQFRSKFHEIFPECHHTVEADENQKRYYCAMIDQKGDIVYEDDYVSQEKLKLGHVSGNKELFKQLREKGFVEDISCLDHASNFHKKTFRLKSDTNLNHENGTQCGKNIMLPINDTNIFMLMREYHDFCYSIHCYQETEDKDELQVLHNCETDSDSNGGDSPYECPCQIPAETENCNGEIQISRNSTSCLPRLPDLPEMNECIPGHLERCLDPKCTDIMEQGNCTSSRCIWCVKENELNNLPSPYCEYIDVCYGGIRGEEPPGFAGNISCDDSETDIILILAISLGCFIIFLLTVLTVCYFKRRRKKKTQAEDSVLGNAGEAEGETNSIEAGPQVDGGSVSGKTKKSQEIKVMIRVVDGDGNELFCKPVQVQPTRRNGSLGGSPNEASHRKNKKFKMQLTKLRRPKKDSSNKEEDTEDGDEYTSIREQRQRRKKQSLRRRTLSETIRHNSPNGNVIMKPQIEEENGDDDRMRQPSEARTHRSAPSRPPTMSDESIWFDQQSPTTAKSYSPSPGRSAFSSGPPLSSPYANLTPRKFFPPSPPVTRNPAPWQSSHPLPMELQPRKASSPPVQLNYVKIDTSEFTQI